MTAIVTNVEEIQGIDGVAGKGLAIRFLGTDGREYVVQVPTGEAYGLADMMGLALTKLATAG